MAQKEGSCGYIDPPSEIPPSIVLGLVWLDIDGFQGESPSSGPKGHGFQVFQVAFGHRCWPLRFRRSQSLGGLAEGFLAEGFGLEESGLVKVGKLCAMHSINNLLQENRITEEADGGGGQVGVCLGGVTLVYMGAVLVEVGTRFDATPFWGTPDLKHTHTHIF